MLDLLARYLEGLVLPVGLNFWHVFTPPDTIMSTRGAVIVLEVAALALVGLLAWRGRPVPAFAFAFMLLPLLPAFAFGGLNQGLSAAFAERYLYLPSFGFLLLVVTGLLELRALRPRLRPVLAASGLALAAAYAAGTVHRNPVWRNSLALWSDVVEKSPASAVARANLGFALLYAGRPVEGQSELRRAIELDPAIAPDWVAKGIGYARHGLNKKAILAFHTALALDPALAEAYFNLGVVYDGEGSRGHAISAYERALSLKPDDATTRNNLGVAYAESGRLDLALPQLEEAARLAPDDPEIRTNLTHAKESAARGAGGGGGHDR